MIIINVSFSDLMLSQKVNGLKIYANDVGTNLKEIYINENGMVSLSQVKTDSADWNSIKDIVNKPIGFVEPLKTIDNRLIVKENKRPLGSNGFCTSRGENPASPLTIGNGDPIRFDHELGDLSPNFSREIFFHVQTNRSWLWDGYLNYIGALFDEFTFQIRPYVTTILSGQQGTNFEIYNNYLLIPAAGTGTKALDPNATLYPCSVIAKTDTGYAPTAYWNLDYSSSTNTYSNLTPATNPNSNGISGNGKYNIFTADICLKQYIYKWGLLGDRLEHFQSSDPSEYGTFLRSVFKFDTRGHADPTQFKDHSWQVLCNFTMFREKLA